MPYQPGETVGDYEVLEILGGGGMGTVYKVRNTISGRVEAMKVVLDNLQSNPEIIDRFLNEIRVLATLEHPNIAALRTAQRVGTQILMVMELVEGWTLHDMIEAHKIPAAHAVRWVHDSLDGLQAAHERGIVHRDIKPANMMVNAQGVLKLMDFGIARLATDAQLTKPGFTMGSLYYMSPEQINAAEIDHRSDIYSMGVTLYQLVTGRKPFEGGSEYSVMAGHLNEPPKPPIEIDPALPRALNGIILTALEKDPARRFQSASAMKTALAHVLDQGALEQPAAETPAKPAAAVKEAAPAPVQPIMRQGNGMRVIYILAGSLATLAVLGVAAIQIPKWFSTRASQTPPPIEESQPPPIVEPTPVPVTDPVPGPIPRPIEDPGTAPPSPVPSATVPVPRTIPGAPIATQAPRAATPATVPASPPPEPQRPSQPQQLPSQPQAQQPAPPPPNDTALAEARERFVLVATRVGAVRGSLDRLRQSQARMGLGLRQDWSAAEQRLIYRMDEAQSSLDGRNATGAIQHLDAAERELSKLEKAMGL